MNRIEAQQALLEQAIRELPAEALPYFGHMRLDTGLRVIDVLLGAASHSVGALSVIDWQRAPLAELFFTCDEGDAYELDLGDRIITGRLLEKTLVTARGNQLVSVEHDHRRYERSHDGRWVESTVADARVPQRPASVRGPFRSPLEVKLDPVQQRAVDLPANKHLLLLGEAGFGKTTVALHRLVALRERARGHFRGAVMVPTEGLKRLTELMLARRHIEDIDVWTYDEWATSSGRRIFRDVPKRLSSGINGRVVQLKRHPALREVMREYVRARPSAPKSDDGKFRGNALAKRADLHHLFGDSHWMNQVIDAAKGALYASAAADVVQHTKTQFSETAEETYRHVDKDRLETMDGRSLDDATPTEDAGTVDVEDFAVLFEIERLRAQRAGEKAAVLGAYHCVVIDEAQEFSPLELSLMRRSLRPEGVVIVSGDAAQQVDTTAFFAGWQEVMNELNAGNAERVVLEINYRCPPQVTAFAQAILSSEKAPAPVSSGQGPITLVKKPHAFHQALWLSETLRALEIEDPSSSVAIVVRSSETAKSMHRLLSVATNAKLALEGEFDFRPGSTVTSVEEVKGLEFDYVIVPDASASVYTPTAQARRSLYVAVTRATHQLVLGCVHAWSELIRE